MNVHIVSRGGGVVHSMRTERAQHAGRNCVISGKSAILLPIPIIPHPHNPMFQPTPTHQATQGPKLQPRWIVASVDDCCNLVMEGKLNFGAAAVVCDPMSVRNNEANLVKSTLACAVFPTAITLKEDE